MLESARKHPGNVSQNLIYMKLLGIFSQKVLKRFCMVFILEICPELK
jgi:hypothetical protein